MKTRDEELLKSIEEMGEDAPGLGICSYPFKILRGEVEALIAERDELAGYRNPMKVNSYRLYAGQCPRCGVVFLDDSTSFCGNCGQALDWGHGSD